MLKKAFKTLGIFIFISLWFLSGWPPIWQNPRIPPEIKEVKALNKVNNWNFNGNSTGWSSTNDNGTNVCGDNNSSTGDTAMATLAYTGSLGNPAGSFQGVSGTSKNINHRGMVHQTVTAPGTGTVKAKGKMDYYANSTSWAAAGTSWIRLDIYDSGNSTFVANLACASFNSNQDWTTFSFSSDVNLTGGTTYTVRATLRTRTPTSNGVTVTLVVDNVVVNFAPTGLAVTAPAETTNAQLDWTTSTAGTGANGLNATTPYKVYRDASSPVSTFLANATTNSYTDSSTTGNTTYYYAITDVDTASDESPKSAEVNILTLPGAPGTPTFTNVKDITLTVNWSAPTGGASSYKIERCSGSGCSNFTEIRTGETGTSYNDSGLTGGTLYRYRVRATNATGDGGYSSIGETTTGIVSITITSDGTVSYGYLAASASKSTVQLSDTQTAQNNGNLAENFNIKTSNATGGTQWTLGATPGTDVFVHEFSTNGGAGWTAFTTADSYQTLATGIAASGTQNFDLRVTVPSTSSDYQQKTITITVQAVAQ